MLGVKNEATKSVIMLIIVCVAASLILVGCYSVVNDLGPKIQS
jgi:hypothetical protein